MAKWQPEHEKSIGKNEQIGRRIFDEPGLVGALNQKPLVGLNIRHFEEKRGEDLSLDRLGRTGVERTVVIDLTRRADRAANKFKPPKPFSGWAVIKADFLQKPPRGPAFPLTPSPDMFDGAEELDQNRYHAHATLPVADSYTSACLLRYLFELHGTTQPPIRSAGPSRVEPIFWREPWKWLRAKFFSATAASKHEAR